MIEIKKFKVDSGMVEILEDSVTVWENAVNRAEQYKREEQIKLNRARKKLRHYLKTGVVLTEEELRK